MLKAAFKVACFEHMANLFAKDKINQEEPKIKLNREKSQSANPIFDNSSSEHV